MPGASGVIMFVAPGLSWGMMSWLYGSFQLACTTDRPGRQEQQPRGPGLPIQSSY